MRMDLFWVNRTSAWAPSIPNRGPIGFTCTAAEGRFTCMTVSRPNSARYIESMSHLRCAEMVNAIDWSFDRKLINAFGQPILQQLEASFNGNQKFRILKLTEDELVLYFDEVIPVSYMGFTADMELRHTEYWEK